MEGPGSGLFEVPGWACGPATLESVVVRQAPSPARRRTRERVVDHASVDHVGVVSRSTALSHTLVFINGRVGLHGKMHFVYTRIASLDGEP